VIVAGARDAILSTRWHSTRLHARTERSWLRVLEEGGHMPHHVAPGQVLAAIDQAGAMAWDRSLRRRPHAGLKEGGRVPPVAVGIMPCG
jgi:hypothetical protein